MVDEAIILAFLASRRYDGIDLSITPSFGAGSRMHVLRFVKVVAFR